jgi:hypothetical protein
VGRTFLSAAFDFDFEFDFDFALLALDRHQL